MHKGNLRNRDLCDTSCPWWFIAFFLRRSQHLIIEAMKQVVHAACPHDCPDACGVLITVEDGHATKIKGDPGTSCDAWILVRESG